MNETASVKPQIRTKSTRSVCQLAERFESELQKESHVKVKVGIHKYINAHYYTKWR